MNNATEFQNQLKSLIYEINILTNAVEFIRNKIIYPTDEVNFKDTVVLLHIISNYASKVQADAETINQTQDTYFSNINK